MSIKHGLLALLREEPKYGYQLRGEFEEATGAIWPLNIGQVYTTLTRLERDGLVRAAAEPVADDGRSRYEITDAGRAELAVWFETPVTRESRPRDELAIKLALALAAPGVDVSAVVQRQRAATMQSLQELTRLKRGDREGEISWLLVLESMIFAAEAEIRWLDHCEAMLLRHRGRPAKPPEQYAEPAADPAEANR
ncbi:PadR family transcriptional regulator [Kribbella sandramycini]|uniref:PadR family transcriptional regulator n=1 Tax=Kribbella sandramycini TaxID=60450 RepID=A0A7Y4L0F3_9ACTN|nr:PadR family transcriptional regulator [Kribbella sandramycini]MBB6565753.1 DNA-binding PadR family transcriptional regulator [Kribbella sandramycini]NOL42015.1 PadR family transcriptional regulator [Kribbella sandramycini]